MKQYNTRAIMASLLICGFIGMFSETALNIAISNLMEVFQISAATAQWLTTGFLLTLGILMPLSGLLLQWFTTRQLFVGSVTSSIIGTLIAALAFNFEMLMVARVLQAIGMGLLIPLMFNTILVVYPPEKRGAAMGFVGLVIMFAPATGPTVAGLLIEYLTWHFIFWLSLPFLVLGLLVGLKYLENVTEVTKPRIDLLSVILSTLGFGGVVFGFSKAGEGDAGWTSPIVIASIAIGLVALALFVLRQLFMREPMMNLRVFKYPMFIVGLLLVLTCMMIILSSMIVLPMYLQQGMKLSPFTAGLMLLPGSALNGFLSPRMGKLFDKYGPKWLVLPGLVVVAAALWFFSGVTPVTSVFFIVALHICLMIGISMVFMPAQTNGLNQLPPELYPHGTAVMNTLQQVAGAVGTAVAISILTHGMERYLGASAAPNEVTEVAKAMTLGSHGVFQFAMIVTLIGLALALFIRRVIVSHGAAHPSH
ncbi:DHA2 family efflux MFS transporter permease subunit [Paenibacillus macerans]|uniref:Drug resistance MFS transporter, drug:H+ antiporter-2 family protein n=1 Tax=Paenibacillus macerans TaxID=44252 RepID=A0A090ZCF1_PAEMA|nr:DHA2 family efflux MFS transporter permease subunit [Paenibacillus macerans]KFN08322.1 drug resistance MFS transporter, drug:H+ antiporter-2 family protein [Paenibacillus macerans]MCY7557613.1 DHA2 family efflux MFS transporter permease subunit [Paenibacillus macerans]MEC0152298.1 DHA2 family efflux MFS transporter permease subunit [Paenibacillus macerans]SUA83745.1 LmrB protein [Paenibacillus macerans]